MKNRIDQLDSIRGLASFAVVLNHLYLVLPMLPLLFKYSPLRVIVNGHASVIMFFVLSGFVLVLPFLKRSSGTYRAFIIRRIIRIYVPYLASIFFAVLMASLLSSGSIPGIDAWQSGISIKLLIEHVFLIFNPDTKAFNNVIWSLVHEMRISLFFPLIALVVMRLNWKMILFICLLLSLPNILQYYLTLGYGYTTILDTMHYTSMFLIGASLAKNKEKLTDAYLNWSKRRKWIVLFVAFPMYAYSTVFSSIVMNIGLPFGLIISDYAATLVSSILIIYVIGSEKIASVLLKKPMIFLGKISYSLYLIHIIVLFSFMYLFYGLIPNALIYLLTVLVSFLLATLSWLFLEKPSIALGKRLTKVEKTHDVISSKLSSSKIV
jgi:peptidoglycan/LPS O-acetylase OafA/YrhL